MAQPQQLQIVPFRLIGQGDERTGERHAIGLVVVWPVADIVEPGLGDRALVLDVYRHDFEPYWAPVEKLFAAMATAQAAPIPVFAPVMMMVRMKASFPDESSNNIS